MWVKVDNTSKDDAGLEVGIVSRQVWAPQAFSPLALNQGLMIWYTKSLTLLENQGYG